MNINAMLFSPFVQSSYPGSDRAFMEYLPLYRRQLRRPPRLSSHHPPLFVAGFAAAVRPRRNTRTYTRQGQTPVSHSLIGPDVIFKSTSLLS